MSEACGFEVAGQIELVVTISPLQLAVVEVALQGASIGRRAIGLNRIPFQTPIQPLHTASQGPIVIEQMLKAQLGHVVVVVQQVVAAFLPDVGVTRGAAALGVIAGQTTVERVVVAHEIAFEDDLGAVVGLPAEYRGDVIAFAVNVIAEALAAFAQYVQAIGQAAVFAERAGGVERCPVHALVIELAAQGHLGFGQRLFADNVEGAAGIATAIQAAGRAAQYFQALDGVGVRRVGVAAVDREAVAIVLARGETAHGDGGQALAAEVVGPAHAAGVIQRVLQAGCASVFEHVLGHHAD